MKLAEEYQTYKSHKDELLVKAEGKFVLIKDHEVVDAFSSYDDALKDGLKRFGNVPFLIKQVTREEDVNFFFNHIAA